MATEWIGEPPTECDLTKYGAIKGHHPITTEFVDAKTYGGPWGCLCPDCHIRFGVGIGPGRGQRYRKQPDGRFLKVEG